MAIKVAMQIVCWGIRSDYYMSDYCVSMMGELCADFLSK